ncbi:hypothetical protein EDD66_10398 [Mobilisporobacter senegalensis]|uniref:Calcineurin-like phosphoesterase domain-containing protein n=1 Tax=Mobilisporobacter senegalensis TaxID=1329262 RepID=A0A3N1XR66_9FIRM|nr:metallophosphoesterase [Mobilisporobacter senegalensis]ROR29163.1 hypothetical protein EDD66_10398 [Mobilisporobacter senegalensis]
MSKMKRRLTILIIIVVLLIIFCFWQNNDIVVSKYQFNNTKIAKSYNGFVIVQISDLHNKEFGAGQRRLLKCVKEQSPDIIVITGDLIDSKRTNVEKAMNFIKGAVDIAPVYFVTGNHELWTNEYLVLKEQMKRAGVIILNNQVQEIQNMNGDTIHIIGLDDNSLYDDTLKNLMDSLNGDSLNILLAHQPEYLSNYSMNNVDLVFSGHAHGGQIRLPFIGGLVAPNQGLLPKYTSGVYVMNDTSMIVSRGLGNSIIPVRVFNRPEIVTVKLNYK